MIVLHEKLGRLKKKQVDVAKGIFFKSFGYCYALFEKKMQK